VGDLDSVPAGSGGGHRMVVPNELSELGRVCEWVRGFAHEHRLAHRAAHWLELSVNEALTNVMCHAYGDNARHEIVVDLIAQPDRIRVEIEDDGIPFNPLEVPMVAQPGKLEKSAQSGRGISLIRSFMDELHYLRRDNRNLLTMVLLNTHLR
jgi:anti-sigma regulatory factor (Ser/Thr protein kinase)